MVSAVRGAPRGRRSPGPRGDARGPPAPSSRSPCGPGPTATTRFPIGFGQTISQPYVVGHHDPAARRRAGAQGPRNRLRLGLPDGRPRPARPQRLLARAHRRARPAAAAALLASLGFHNVSIKAFDGTYGYPAAAPYDRILVTAGTERCPSPCSRSSPWAAGSSCRSAPRQQRLRVIRRRKTDYAQEEGEDVTFVPLLGRFGGTPA